MAKTVIIPAGGGGGVAALAALVFRPGGVQGGNVFTSWADLIALNNGLNGPRTIQIDDSITTPAVIPAGTYQLRDTQLVGRLSDGAGDPVVCDVADGAVLDNLNVVRDGLRLRFNTTGAGQLTYTDVAGAAPTRLVVSRAFLENRGTAAALVVPPAAGSLISLLNEGTINTGLFELIDVPAGNTLQLFARDVATTLDPNTIRGAVGSVLLLGPDASSAATVNPAPGQTNFLGALTSFLTDAGISVGYAASVPGDWVGAPPTNINTAIDRIAAALGPIA